MNRLMPIHAMVLFGSAILPAASLRAPAADWPTWRCDARRSGVSPQALGAGLRLQWVRQLPPPRPAWPPANARLQFDASYEPVVMGDTLFVPSMVSDHVTAYDTDTGNLKWRYYTDGPVRFAPVAWEDRVYCVSDDGCLHCLQAGDGTLLWRFRGGPGDRRVLGNGRLISAWPARGAPVIRDGTVYFAAGIWPFMGIFIHAVDARTGQVKWTNSGSGSTYITQAHEREAFAGVAPQGYLALTGNSLLVAGGRTPPAVLDARSGELLHYDPTHREGSYAVFAGRGWFHNRGDVFRIGQSQVAHRCDGWTCIGDELVKADAEGGLAVEQIVIDAPGRAQPQPDIQVQSRWEARLPVPIDQVHIRAGRRYYASAPGGWIGAVEPPRGGRKAGISWADRVAGEVWTMLAGDGKLFVVTRDGQICCFGDQAAEPRRHELVVTPQTEAKQPAGQAKLAADVIAATEVHEGYGLVLGAADGSLIDRLIQQSELEILVLLSDAGQVAALRERLEAAGQYGRRVAVHAGDILSIELPPYFASLAIVGEGAATNDIAGAEFIGRLFRSLRPYGGVASLPAAIETATLTRRAEGAGLDSASVESAGAWTLLRRTGALPGAADWTHHYSDCANTVFSPDRLVKAPLGLLWFGGPSNDKVLPRHGHAPAPLVIDGRVLVQGPDMLRAVDVYTGRLLWERDLPGVGRHYDFTGHQTGAGAMGSNYVAAHDGIYVACENRCLVLDPASGRTRAEFQLPRGDGEADFPEWGFIARYEDLLLATASPIVYYDPDFFAEEFRHLLASKRARQLRTLTEAVAQWPGVRPCGEGDAGVIDWFVANCNHAIRNPGMDATIPDDHKENARRWPELAERVAEARRELDACLRSIPGPDPEGACLRNANRRLLAAYYFEMNFPDREPIHSRHAIDRLASPRLVCLDRHDGRTKWSYRARHAIRHNTIVAGNGRVFCIDRLPDPVVDRLERRGQPVREAPRLIAFDAASGKEIWSTSENVFGTWLGYSARHDILVAGGSREVDRARDEAPAGITAYRGSDGGVLWRYGEAYGGPLMIHNDMLVTQPARLAPDTALDLRTGRRTMRQHPLNGTQVPWRFARGGGCDTAIAGEHLLTFRAGAAGYCDLLHGVQSGSLGGFRSGCTCNLIPANGVLSAPDYTRTCTCSFQNQCSLALVHDPQAETWTYSALDADPSAPILRLGINLGAPGDRMAEDGTLWLDYPSTGGPSPDPPITIEPAGVGWFRYHSSRMSGDSPGWVSACGAIGLGKLTMTLAPESAADRPYTVRLFFAEIEPIPPGGRVFDILVQGQAVRKRFDPIREAGGADRGVVVESRGIPAGRRMSITLSPASARTAPPILCGLEIIAEPQ